MNRTTGVFTAILLGVLFLGGCTASTGLITNANAGAAERRCAKLDKDVVKVDHYIEVVTRTDAFHLEEAAEAVQEPDITTSTNKREMLKDANRLKNSLNAERKQLACQ